MKSKPGYRRRLHLLLSLGIILIVLIVSVNCGGGSSGGSGGGGVVTPTATPTTPQGYGIVKGTIVDQNGSPVAGASVSWGIYGKFDNDRADTAITDENGNYLLNNVPSGNQVITAIKGEYAVSFNVDVEANTSVTATPATPEPSGSITGRITQLNTVQPVADVMITVIVQNWDEMELVKYSSNQGYYTIQFVPVGTHTITTRKASYYDTSSEVTVTQGQSTRKDIAIQLGVQPTQTPTTTPTTSPTASPTASPSVSPTGSPTPTPTSTVINNKFVVFESNATNLVNGDTNNCSDIFIKNRATGQTTRVSVATSGTQADKESHDPHISNDGRYVCFRSNATNLFSGSVNDAGQIYLRDSQTGETKIVSASGGAAGNKTSSQNSISANGRYVVFQSYANNLTGSLTDFYSDVFLYDSQTGQIIQASTDSSGNAPNGHSSAYDWPTVSEDGKLVAFSSEATNLVANDTNGKADIFVKNTQTGAITRVSVNSSGTQADNESSSPVITPDGKYVLFASLATNLATGYESGSTNVRRLFIHTISTGKTVCVSVNSSGTGLNAETQYPSISSDGQTFYFVSNSPYLVAGVTDGIKRAFSGNINTGEFKLVSSSSSGTACDKEALYGSISQDGKDAVFTTQSTNLATGGGNNIYQIFVKNIQSGTIDLISTSSSSTPGNSNSERCVIR